MKKVIICFIIIIFVTFITTYAFYYVMGKYEKSETTTLSNKVLSDSNTYTLVRRSPVGQIISYMGENPPSSFLECDGSIYNIRDYPHLAEQIKNEFGSYNKFGGNGTSTFAVPDLRGEFLRGRGTNSHTAQGNGSTSGTHQNGTGLPWYYRVNSSFNGIQMITPSASQGIANGDYLKLGNGHYSNIYQNAGSTGTNLTTMFTVRPTNTSVLYAIRYE